MEGAPWRGESLSICVSVGEGGKKMEDTRNEYVSLVTRWLIMYV